MFRPCLRPSFSWASFRRYTSTEGPAPRVCVVGSGPAGFYTAQHLLNHGPPQLRVDLLERLPVPFGLVRFGVAPDHPEVKNVDHTFTKIAKNPRVQFYGNLHVGVDVKVRELRQLYDIVILSYGAAQDRKLGVPGEELSNVISARSFVGFYNGLPEDAALAMNLDVEDAAVIGIGNVALDVARVLLTPIDTLRQTDITDAALAQLSQSRIKRVFVIGRRGPLQVSFTIKELREMVNLEGCSAVFNPDDFRPFQSVAPLLKRPRKRLTELMLKTALTPPTEKQLKLWGPAPPKSWELRLLRSPLAILGSDSSVSGVQLGVNRLDGPNLTEDQAVVSTGEVETLECGLVLKSIGYKSVKVEEGIPFDEQRGVIPNVNGKVPDEPGLYCSGWLATGPKGVIVDTMNESYRVGAQILEDLKLDHISVQANRTEELRTLLDQRQVKVVNFVDWEKIDETEKLWGASKGKPREKITEVQSLISVVKKP
ncbi:hypothetical protein TCAL_13814 [Tigriopus californicus]|uniref:NADPH:adrenodoxin oxidoreductase, mitochondrial n=1 Tax=Tigriopus californicus TaxID=6832 RepID=A0A553PHA5_TIGCA|nr:NADPH:adrenodoxin oxidoreductase, mitochondrial-like [Tigriopus californicus]TRY77055.1 hypothetical protein TCAL_13814 [Tigriopus californicus]|eukprot:TCALIF_13814-PA protein Name:"Similar to fdxr NADPH:adrenodoxin oxidoreductase, mitochondrial (Salvelinus fontinalis)" AED:0.10 eAED:0.10 QI:0/-1/0/1/-1/1/1/0/481